MKRVLFVFTIVAAMALTLASCAETIVKLSKNLDGTWSATSYTVDGVEILGDSSFITGVTLAFMDEGDGMGDVTITLNSIFGSDAATGTYEVLSENDVDQLVITTVEDSTTDVVTMNMDLDGKDLTLTFTEDGETAIIQAAKQ